MNPLTHFFLGWGVATSAKLNKRGRAAVTIAGIIPDLDGLGIIGDKLTAGSAQPLTWWSDYHHVLGHNLAFGLLVTVVAALVSKAHRIKVLLLSFLSFHLHLLGDLVGARGPEGYQWPIVYLYPFSNSPELVWNGQWALNSWPNFIITGLALAWMFYITARRGYSPLEFVSDKADVKFVETIRYRLKMFRY